MKTEIKSNIYKDEYNKRSMKKSVVIAGLFVVLALSLIGIVSAETIDNKNYIKGEVYLTFYGNTTEEEINNLINSKSLEWKDQKYPEFLSGLGWFQGIVKVPEGEEQKWIDIFKNESIVQSADLNMIVVASVQNCSAEETKDYTCLDGTKVHWCDCSEGIWTCANSPETICRDPIINCKNLYWIDNDNKNCSQKQFCGAYMYYGLQTFESKTQCEKALNESKYSCLINSPFVCKEYYLSNKNISLLITQMYGESINVMSISVSNCGSNNNDGSGWIVANSEVIGGSNGVTVVCNNSIRDNFEGYITIAYNKLENTKYTFVSTGEIEKQEEQNICPEGSESENNSCYKTLSNGRKAEIKIMPETASETAIARLGNLGFTIELKEVGNKTRDTSDDKVVYELTGNKQGKFLGIFKIIARVQAQVDAETGNVKVIKPWWSFLATKI